MPHIIGARGSRDLRSLPSMMAFLRTYYVCSQIVHVTVYVGRQSVGGPGTSQAVRSKQERRSINVR